LYANMNNKIKKKKLKNLRSQSICEISKKTPQTVQLC
jgi:hypothetical protein